MKRLLFFVTVVICSLISFAGEVIILTPPIGRIGELSISSGTMSTKPTKKSGFETSSYAYFPVFANVDEVQLTVTFSENVGTATVLVYDANNQLVDMTTVDTGIETEAVLSTELWQAGEYRLVVTYSTTTLQGNFNF